MPTKAPTRAALAKVRRIGRVVLHEQLYDTSAIRPVTCPGQGVPVSYEVVYGAAREELFDAQLDEAQVARALMSYCVLQPSSAPPWMHWNAYVASRVREAFKDAAFAKDPVAAMKNTLDMRSQCRDAPTVEQYIQSKLHRATLPLVCTQALLYDHEAHSAGCVRCCRRFWEPAYHNVIDAQRTQALQDALDVSKIASTARRRQQLDRHCPGLVHAHATSAHADYLRPSACVGHDIFPDQLLDADAQPLVSRGRPPTAKTRQRTLQWDATAWEIKIEEDVLYQGAVDETRDASDPHVGIYIMNARRPNQQDAFVVAVRSKNHRQPYYGLAQSAHRCIRLYRCGASTRADSNLCRECAAHLHAAGLLVDRKPTELRLGAEEMLHASRAHETTRLAVIQSLLDDTSLGTADLALLKSAIVRAQEMHAQFAKHDHYPRPEDVPYSYVRWQRRRLQHHEEDGTCPAFDASVLLRMGLLDGDAYARLIHAQRRPAFTGTVSFEVTVGDMVTKLADPALDKAEALRRHSEVVVAADALLARERLPPEIQNALLDVKAKHHVAHIALQQGSGQAAHEWQLVNIIDKKLYAAGVIDVSNERKAASSKQARSYEMSTFVVELKTPKRATFNAEHNQYVMRQLSRAAERLLTEPEHLASVFKFGLVWNEDHWQPWVPSSTRDAEEAVGHYVLHKQGWLVKEAYAKPLRGMNRQSEDDATAERKKRKISLLTLTCNQLQQYVDDQYTIGSGPVDANALGLFWDANGPRRLCEDHPYAQTVRGPIMPADEYMTDTYQEMVKSVSGSVHVHIAPVSRLFSFQLTLKVGHVSKIQLDRRALEEYFVCCWRGHLFGSELAIQGPGGELWLPPHEHVEIGSVKQSL
jgi:hypothetical protein